MSVARTLHLGALGLIAAAGAVIYGIALRIPPFDADNLVVLTTSVCARSDPLELFTGSFVSYASRSFAPRPQRAIHAS